MGRSSPYWSRCPVTPGLISQTLVSCLECSEAELAQGQGMPSPRQDESTGSLLKCGQGRWQQLKADGQFPLYLQGLLQSRDVFTADFHVVQSHLGDETKNVTSCSSVFMPSPAPEWLAAALLRLRGGLRTAHSTVFRRGPQVLGWAAQ